MKTIKVGMITGGFYPDYSGSARQALSIARVMNSKNVPVTVFTLDMQKNIWTSPTTLDYVENIPVYRIPGRTRSKIEILVRHARFIFECWRRRNLFDIVHAHGLREGYLGMFVSKLTCKPALAKLVNVVETTSHWFAKGALSEEDLGAVHDGTPLNNRIQQQMTRKLDRVVCTTSRLQSISREMGLAKSKLALIPNGVDVGHFRSLPAASKRKSRKAFGWSPDEFVLISALSVRRLKGLDILLDAWLQLKSRLPRRLLIIGPSEAGMTGVDQGFVGEIHRQAEKTAGYAPITFAGQVDDIQPYLSAANAFVLPSRSEGFPNTALEAMASGLPCIFSSISWTTEVVEDEVNALLFTPEDSGHLCRQINRLMKNRTMQYRLGRSARKAVEKRFAIEAVAEQYSRLYRKILGAKRRKS
ncbi:MAG TPA: glycosyltransferase family 4 protein [bacterium]